MTKRKTLKQEIQLILTALGTGDVHGKRGRKYTHLLRLKFASSDHQVNRWERKTGEVNDALSSREFTSFCVVGDATASLASVTPPRPFLHL